MAGTNTCLDHLELTYSDLGNVIQVKVNYANGESNTITPRQPRGIRRSVRPELHPLYGQRGGGGARCPLQRQPTGEELSCRPALPHQRNRGPEPGGPGCLCDLRQRACHRPYGRSRRRQPGNGNTGNTAATEVTVCGSSYVFNGSGNGHQVGMSQFGANAMARQGFAYDDIVEFYFPGTHVGSYR